jgi:phosphatidylethanolamine-binding protein (PEBP) family uncharacterized protein
MAHRHPHRIAGQPSSNRLSSWAGFPDSTQSFIVTMYDPDNAHLERVLALSHSP